jgi:hypothetical protein
VRAAILLDEDHPGFARGSFGDGRARKRHGGKERRVFGERRQALCVRGWYVSSDNRLLEKVLVDFLDVKGVLNSAPDVVANHEFGQLLAVDQNDSLTEILGSLYRGRGKD